MIRAQINFQSEGEPEDSTVMPEDTRGHGPNPKEGTEPIFSVPETRTRHSGHRILSERIDPAPEGPAESHMP